MIPLTEVAFIDIATFIAPSIPVDIVAGKFVVAGFTLYSSVLCNAS